MDVAFHINSLKTKVRDFRTLQAIKKKWTSDSKELPLTPDHWELYVIIHKLCLKELGEFPNLVNCRDFNDRIQWLKLFDQDEEIVRCSDKLGVRGYVTERIGGSWLNEVYQVCDSFDQINFDILPRSFVIKVNHDSGTVILVEDKALLDKERTRIIVNEALRRVYGWSNGEWAYKFIPPKVFVEKFVGLSGVRPPDFRCHCNNGEVAFVQNDIPFEGHFKEVTLTADGRPLNIHFSSHKYYSEEAVCHKNWSVMIQLAKQLSRGWKYVRVDFLIIDDEMYVNELTFFPYRGTYAGKGQVAIGRLIDFDRSTHKTPVVSGRNLARLQSGLRASA